MKKLIVGFILAAFSIFGFSAAAFAGPYDNHPWAGTFLNALYDKGAIGNYEDTEGYAQRREIARYVVRSYNFPYGGKSISFTDVNGSTSDFESIEKAASCGTINGYSDGTFRPNSNITRAEFAVILAKTMTGDKVPSYSGSSFPDVLSGHWAKDAIAYCREWGVVGGYPDGNFRPDGLISRAEAARMIYSALQAHPGLPNDWFKPNGSNYGNNCYDGNNRFEHNNPYGNNYNNNCYDNYYDRNRFEHQNPGGCNSGNYDNNYNNNNGNFEHQNPGYNGSSNNYQYQNNNNNQNFEHTNPY